VSTDMSVTSGIGGVTKVFIAKEKITPFSF